MKKPRALGGDFVFALALLVVASAYLAIASTYAPALRAVPAAVASVVVVLLLLDLLSRTSTRLGRSLERINPPSERAPYPLARQLEAMLWIAGLAAGLVLLGVLVAIPLFVFAFLRFRGQRAIITSAFGAGCAAAFIWLLFSVLLRLPLYPGILFGGS